MGASDIISLVQAGPWVTIIGYLIWEKTQERQVVKDRIETDKALASSMALLSARIEGMKP